MEPIRLAERMGERWRRRGRSTNVEGRRSGWSYPPGADPNSASDAELIDACLDTAYACAMLNAQGVAEVDWRLYATDVEANGGRRCVRWPTRSVAPVERGHVERFAAGSIGASGEPREVVEHPLLDLLARPARDRGRAMLSRVDLFLQTQLWLETAGRAYWRLECDAAGRPTSIWPVPPHCLEPRRDPRSAGFVEEYVYHGVDGRRTISADELVVFRTPDPSDPYSGGLGPLRAALSRVRLTSKALDQTHAMLDNRARPDAVVSPATPEGVIGHDEAKRLETLFNQKYRGAGAGGVYVARDSLRVDPLSFSPRDMGELAEQTANIQQIMRVFGVPPALLFAEANRATAQTARRQHASLTLAPRLRRLSDTLNAGLVRLYEPSGRLFLAPSNPTPEDREQLRADIVAYVRAGVMTVGEARRRLGLPTEPTA